MKSHEERLQEWMEKGYDVRIECKGVGRNFAMTYEATLMHSSPVAPEGENPLKWMMIQSHSLGNTMDELLDGLESNFGNSVPAPKKRNEK